MRKAIVCCAALSGVIATELPAHPAAPATFLETARPYAKYEFLIGDWYGDLGGTKLREQFRWGPKQSYIFFATYVATDGKPEQIHFEGMMVWNARTDVLDYVVAVEPGSGVQEKGSVRAEADGTVIREVELTYASGKTGQFRQTFQNGGSGKLMSAVMKQTSKGWEPTFPGSDKLVLVRSPD